MEIVLIYGPGFGGGPGGPGRGPGGPGRGPGGPGRGPGGPGRGPGGPGRGPGGGRWRFFGRGHIIHGGASHGPDAPKPEGFWQKIWQGILDLLCDLYF